MNDDGAAESLGTILMIGILLIVAAGVSIYAMNVTGESMPEGYTPQYAYVEADVVPALSAAGTWNADSLKIDFLAGNELNLQYDEGTYSGTEGIKFLLYDPSGNMHEAVQCISMKGQKIKPGAVFYFFTIPSGEYLITNNYTRIGDDSSWAGVLAYPVAFANGKWRIVIIDDYFKVIIADEEVLVE